MAGLLAWAADVVGGNGADMDMADRTLRLTPQQRQSISALDVRAAELQHSLQQLRQRMPPSDIAQRFPHLHADSLASHSTLALEKHAHTATVSQVQFWCVLGFCRCFPRVLLKTSQPIFASLCGICRNEKFT